MRSLSAKSPGTSAISLAAAHGGHEPQLHHEAPGDGVDPEELARLMAPFEQGENALTRSSEGAGLGLPIADLTCKGMGGRLKLSSAPGQGLTASVRLPAG